MPSETENIHSVLIINQPFSISSAYAVLDLRPVQCCGCFDGAVKAHFSVMVEVQVLQSISTVDFVHSRRNTSLPSAVSLHSAVGSP